MKNLLLSLIALFLVSCQSSDPIVAGMTKANVEHLLGQADSVVVLPSTKDVYTNKLIEMEVWYYSNDTILTFAKGKLVKGL